jgi:AraC-like DNA-binding protein
MRYREFTPCKKLRPFINCYWYFEGTAGATVTDCTFPDGSLEIIFNIATSVSRSQNDRPFTSNPSSELIGQMTQPYNVRFSGLNRLFGIRFFPHTFSCFTREPLMNINDVTIDPQDVLGREFKNLASIVHGEEDPGRYVHRVEEFLMRKIYAARVDHKHELLEALIRKIFAGEVNSIVSMQAKSGYNERYLQRLFSERIGINPKFLLKITRFQRSFQYLKAHTALTTVAYESGYFDQAHFNRDFKFFTGTTPSTYLEQPYSINRIFLSTDRNCYMYGMHRAEEIMHSVGRNYSAISS